MHFDGKLLCSPKHKAGRWNENRKEKGALEGEQSGKEGAASSWLSCNLTPGSSHSHVQGCWPPLSPWAASLLSLLAFTVLI